MLKGHRILLTGLTGQVAGAFAEQLGPVNEVWGLARYTKPGSRERVEKAGVKAVVGDFAKGEFPADMPTSFDYVIHVAANTKPGTAEVGMTQNAEGSGLLMYHFRDCKAFLFVSNSSLYLDNPDPMHKYVETDHVGGWSPHSPNYGPTKLASEGAIRALCRIHNIPTTIARLNVAYGGPYDDGGMPGNYLEALIEGRPIKLPKGQPFMVTLIHEDDMVRHLEPMLNTASVPATVVNWAGGEGGVSVEDWVNYLGEITGITPKYEYVDGGIPPNRIFSDAFPKKIGMDWTVKWRDGMRRMVELRHPELKLKPA